MRCVLSPYSLVDILNENGPQALMTVNGRYVDRLVLSSCGRGDVRVVSFDRS